MNTTTDRLPIRPRGAARHAANTTTIDGAYPTRRARRAAEAVPEADSARGPEAGAREHGQPATVQASPPLVVPVVSPSVTAGAVTHEATGASAIAPGAPVSTPSRADAGPAACTDPLPSRRALRPVPRPTRPAELGRAVTRAITLPLRTVGSVVSSAKAVPLTATAVVACLVVTVATPQTAAAATPQAILPTLDVQEYTVSGASTIAVQRDAFAIGRVPVREPASPTPSETAGPTSVRPVAGTIPAAGGFGSRWVRGCAACSTNHQGLDFAAPTGTAVVAAMSGRVVSAGVFGGYGNQVLLQHADGSQTRYGHLSQIGVRAGQTVTAGQRIGAVGNTGVSTGAHLHFEVIVGGTPVDPAVWLRDRGLL